MSPKGVDEMKRFWNVSNIQLGLFEFEKPNASHLFHLQMAIRDEGKKRDRS